MCRSVCLHVCMCTVCMQCPWRPEKGVGSLDLELETIVSCHVGAGNRTVSFGKAAGAFNHSAIVLASKGVFSKQKVLIALIVSLCLCVCIYHRVFVEVRELLVEVIFFSPSMWIPGFETRYRLGGMSLYSLNHPPAPRIVFYPYLLCVHARVCIYVRAHATAHLWRSEYP